MKTTKNKTKPTFVVDFTNISNVNEISAKIARAKVDAGIPLTKDDLTNVIESAIDDFVAELYEAGIVELAGNVISPKHVSIDFTGMFDCPNCENCECKKPNIFKRFWNWLTHKK